MFENISFNDVLTAISLLGGYITLWFAVDSFRPNDKIKTYSKQWWIQFLLIMIGTSLIVYASKNLN